MNKIKYHIDFFGINHLWKYLDKEKHFSNLSFILSLLLVCILIIKICKMFYSLYIIRTDNFMKTTNTTDLKLNINISDIKI